LRSGNVFDLIGRCELHVVFSGNLLGNHGCLNVVIMLKLYRGFLLRIGCKRLYKLCSGNVFDLIGRCELHPVFSGNLLGIHGCLDVVIMLKLYHGRLL